MTTKKSKLIFKIFFIGWTGLMFLLLIGSMCSGLEGSARYLNTPAGSVGVVLGMMTVIAFWGMIWAVLAVPSGIVYALFMRS